MKKMIFAFAAVMTMAVASASTHTITIYEKSSLNGVELAPGQYKIEVNGDKLMIKNGKKLIEAPVTVSNGPAKFASTTVRFKNTDGKYAIQEIRVGGTTMNVKVNNADSSVD